MQMTQEQKRIKLAAVPCSAFVPEDRRFYWWRCGPDGHWLIVMVRNGLCLMPGFSQAHKVTDQKGEFWPAPLDPPSWPNDQAHSQNGRERGPDNTQHLKNENLPLPHAGRHHRQLVEQQEYETARDIIADLLNHPYPYDLMAIRREAARYDSETSAMVEMDAYCTEKAALKARADWNNAQETAKKFLKKQ